MPKETLPQKKKIQIFFLGVLLVVVLNLISDLFQLNDKANRTLTNILNIPMLTKGAADDIMEKFYPGRRPGGY